VVEWGGVGGEFGPSLAYATLEQLLHRVKY
jgi:hypothetical protein